jgi:CDP-glucose 4,6-dehydratase
MVRIRIKDAAADADEAVMTNRFWTDRPVLVTGATGLLGSWLSRALLARGARVIVIVRDELPDAAIVTAGDLERCVRVRGDVEDGRLVERVLVEHEVDAVFHLAAQTIVEHAVRDPLGTLRANVAGTWELLDACRRSGRAARIVVASSDKAYGTQPVLPYTEDQPLEGRHPYDVSKSCADLIASAYANTYGLPLAITRCGNLFGGGDLNFSRLVPGTIRHALRSERPVLRSDGSPLRDYLHVDDAVDAYLAIAERLHDPAIAGEAWNVSCEQPQSVLEMTTRVLAAAGRADLDPVVLGEARHEIPHQYLSAAKLRDRLGWKPSVGLDEGLARTVAWYRAHLAVPALARTA